MTRWDEEMVVLTVKNGGVLEGWWMEEVEVMVVERLAEVVLVGRDVEV